MTRGMVSKTLIKCNATYGEDRISSLPDDIIGHILSFLPTKYSVATSILSKRWRYLWTNITNLSFENSTKFYDHPLDHDQRFDKFVDRVLQQCVSKQIEKFYLCTWAKSYRVEAWINEAIRRNVRVLGLAIFEVPPCVFTCKTLTVLNLQGMSWSRCEIIPTSFYLPSLRILFIDVSNASNNLTEKLFRSCPVIEDLKITGCSGEQDSDFIISAPLLKRLTYYNFKGCGQDFSYSKFVINAPNLEIISIHDDHYAYYKMENVLSIAEANVALGRLYFNGKPIANRAVELLRGLSGVKSLSLSYMTMRVLAHTCDQHHLPIFYNMTRLKLFNFEPDGRKVLPRLLEVCPKLKVLIWKKNKRFVPNSEGACDWSEPQNLPECLSSWLEVVEFEGFEGNGFELKLVKYLLEHAVNLKKLTINTKGGVDPKTKREFCERFLEFPRSSKTCQVYLLGDLLNSF